jgi:CO/xanthine dehydrogenase FAD-binding subunit
MATSVLIPKTISELVRIVVRKGKDVVFSSGDGGDRPPAGKVTVDISQIGALQEISAKKDKVIIGSGLSLGKLSREAAGENGLIRQAALLVANPLVRNRVTFMEALDPRSSYFDITTPLVLLDARVRLQGPASKRTLSIREFLDQAAKGLKKGELPVAVEFAKLPGTSRVGFFRVARENGKGSVSAAVRTRLAKNVAMDPEVVVSSLTVIPLRSKVAEKELARQQLSEETIKRAAAAAAEEVSSYAEKPNPYEKTLVEITVSRTLRDIMEGAPGL